MQYTSLNKIVKSVLNQKGHTIHFYYQYLKYAADCLRELHFDSLRVVQTKKLPVNAHNAVPLPCDYVDMVKVGLVYGQQVLPLVQHTGLNRLNNFDSTGNIIMWGTTDEENFIWSGSHGVDQNTYGEPLGRAFGFKDSNLSDGFRILPERSEIQLSEYITADYVILEYISDGTGLTDAATKIDPYAQKPIEEYIEWQGDPKQRGDLNSPKGVKYWASVRVLRARKNPIRPDDVRRAQNRNKQAGPK